MSDNSKDRIAKMMSEVHDDKRREVLEVALQFVEDVNTSGLFPDIMADRPSAKNLENVIIDPTPKQRDDVGWEPVKEIILPEDFFYGGVRIGKEDPGYCGAFGVETGPRDPHWPACAIHDPAFVELLDGKTPNESSIRTQWNFTKQILRNAVSGLYAVVSAPVYILLGVGVGVLRWNQLSYRNNAKRGIKPPEQSSGE